MPSRPLPAFHHFDIGEEGENISAPVDPKYVRGVRVGNVFPHSEETVNFLLELLDASGERLAGRLFWGKKDGENIKWQRIGPDQVLALSVDDIASSASLLDISVTSFGHLIPEGRWVERTIIRFADESVEQAVKASLRHERWEAAIDDQEVWEHRQEQKAERDAIARDNFDALTDGYLGDYNSFHDSGGHSDRIDDWAGL